MHGIGHHIRYSYTFFGILVLVFLKEFFEALDCAPLDHLYIDIGSHFVQLFSRFARLTLSLIVTADNIDLGADFASR